MFSIKLQPAKTNLEFLLEGFENFPKDYDFMKKDSTQIRFFKAFTMAVYSSLQSANKFQFPPTAKNSSQRETIPYICDLGAKVGCERLSEHSTCND